MSELIFQRGGEDLLRVSINRPCVEVGRGPGNDVAIPDSSISRSQFSIIRRGTRAYLVDASGRGTCVNGEREKEVWLDDGAEIEIGAWRARFREERSAEEGMTDPRALSRSTAALDLPEVDAVPFESRLRVRSETGLRHVPFHGEVMGIGTEPDNDLALEDRFVSAFHAQLTRTRSGFWLRDLGSTNGTYLRGSRVREAEVPIGAIIRLGQTELSLERCVPSGAVSGSFEGLVGRDPALLHLFELIDRVAPASVAVTIFGETGTGKELVARSIHARSLRRDRPFVPVNCAALHRELIESELFGHEKGAFTGADRSRPGAFEEACSGTLFLDEIGELSSDLQAKLLRVLESGEVRRLGSSKPALVDVRIVAATHVDLLPMVRKGLFREDLYYRLCVFPLIVPPLRHRHLDLAALSDHFLALHAPPGLTVQLTLPARTKLASHTFPGNVRELRNVIQRALLLRSGTLIQPEHIVFDAPYRDSLPHPVRASSPRLDTDENLFLPGRTLKECTDEIVVRAVRRHACKTASASELGISRTTVVKLTKHLAQA